MIHKSPVCRLKLLEKVIASMINVPSPMIVNRLSPNSDPFQMRIGATINAATPLRIVCILISLKTNSSSDQGE